MKVLMGLIFLSMTLNVSFAGDLQMGLYTGVDSLGNECSINLMSQTFAHDIRNPLNEQLSVEITFNGKSDTIVLGHPLDFDKKLGKVSFDHDHFQGYKGFNGGAKLVRASMKDHKIDHFHYFVDQWNTHTKAQFSCHQLRF